MAQARLKSSFIYLANAVNDFRGGVSVLAIIIAPLALATALCLLPDALNLQHRVVQTFQASEGQVISFHSAQTPIRPDRPEPPPLYPGWFTTTLHFLSLAITMLVRLVVLCALQRMQNKTRLPDPVAEGIAIYRRAIELAPAFGLVILLQWLATLVGFALLVIPGLLAYVWLYFTQYALVFNDQRSWHALLYSRDAMRGRFFKVAIRLVVFLAVWSGYHSWGVSLFVAVSLLLEPISVMTDTIAATIFMMDLLFVAASYATAAFIIAAGVRMYQDLFPETPEQPPATAAVLPPTVPLGDAS